MSNLYLTYRPESFDDILGNESAVSALKNMVANPDKAPHVFLFDGPKGCGKTSMARILANEFGISSADLRELDTADFRGIDSIREIRQNASYLPLEGDKRMWILDECHQLTNAAQSALLKILEDTPKHVYFALCTTDPQKLLKTVKDRCTRIQVEPLDDSEMKKLLIRTCKAEGEKVEKKVLKQIILDSQGHPRAALQILDQVLRVEPDQRMKVARRKAEIESQGIELARLLIKPGTSWRKIQTVLQGLRNEDPEGIRRMILGYCSSVMLNKENDHIAAVMEEFLEPFYDSGFPGLVYACYAIIKG